MIRDSESSLTIADTSEKTNTALSVDASLHGSVLVLIQFDVCEEIRLDRLREIFGARTLQQPTLKHPAPGYIRYQRPPVVEPIEPLVLESGERLFNVVNGWSADQDDVRLEVPERLRIIGKTFTLEFVAAILQRCGTGVARTELLQSQRLEVLCVTPADGTAADHQASISNPLGSS